ncbi:MULTISPECIES: hypothetical protein [unclassified Mycoplasma]|uniref:hypothetical protein n=1 Tax=unclassified Mycoplasma TaxID=2683645 RepID=UPI00211C7B5D|nr:MULTISPECIES: hypothetical protein [unclassified Mycoplasma]UUM20066.1 hypothetical protein NPA11_01410 [Mycoplasma sp. 1578d]UUM25046.1 hypothetical protein NPA12_01385 [Mycoplasma sp. 3686d]
MKIKLFKRILFSSIPLGIFGALGAIAYFKHNNNFKPSFYNYKSYMSSHNIKEIGEKFEYKEFDSLQEFTRSLIDNKAIAGIGSDFQAAGLIKNKRLAKIDYSRLFNDPSLKNNKKRTEQYLKLIIHPIVWEHILSYDEYLNNSNTPESQQIHLWEYFFPYYMQDSVVAYNVAKNRIKPENANEDGEIDFSKYEQEYKDNLYDMSSILKILSQNNFKYWNITDSNRDNMVYGSTYWAAPKEDGDQRINKHSGAVTHLTYAKLIDSFVDLIQDNTGYRVGNTEHINFLGDGLTIVNNLIHPNLKTNAAIMYNGDAIDSYYGSDNIDGVEDGNVRIVRPKGNLLLVDGLVISSKISETSAQEIIKNVRNNIYQEIPNIGQTINSLEKDDPQFLDLITQKKIHLLQEKVIANYWKNLQQVYFENYFKEPSEYVSKNLESFIENIYNHIDLSEPKNIDKFNRFYNSGKKENPDFYINPYPQLIQEYLTTQFKEQFASLSQKVFDFYQKNEQPEELLNILKSQLSNSSQFDILINILINEFEAWSKTESLDDEVKKSPENLEEFLINIMAWKLALVNISSDELSDQISEKWKNLQNYDFINYDPVLNTDYEFIRRNYFADYIDKIDHNAIKIYDIKPNDGVDRVAIKPIDDQLRSLIADYYFKKTKN